DVFLESLREAGRLLVSGDGYVWQILLLSLRVSGAGVLLGLLIGLPIGIAVGLLRFPGRGLVISLIHTGFALPPVVVGLFVYMVFSRSGPAGHLELLFTPAAMIIAQALLAAPYVAGISMAAVQAVPPDVRLQARGLGASPARALRTHLAEARLGIFAAVVAGFGAVVAGSGAASSEVGRVMMGGGNMAGESRVRTTAIVRETRRGNFATALAFGLVLLFLAFVVNALLTRAQQARTRAGVHRPFA